jgi:hypothetical protein
MSSHPAEIRFEPLIWARLIESQSAAVTPDIARFLLSIQFGAADRKRISELAEKSNEGTLSTEESAELDSYLHIGNLLTVMQSRARSVLGKKLSPADLS